MAANNSSSDHSSEVNTVCRTYTELERAAIAGLLMIGTGEPFCEIASLQVITKLQFKTPDPIVDDSETLSEASDDRTIGIIPHKRN